MMNINPDKFGLNVTGVLSMKEVNRQNLSKKKKNMKFNLDAQLRDYGIQEISIPINSEIRKLPQAKMFKLVEMEYATIYLERIGVDPNRDNLKRILESVPLRKCRIRYRKGLSETLYLVVRPNIKKQYRPKDDLAILLDPLVGFNERKALLSANDDKKVSRREKSFDSDLQLFTEQFSKLRSMYDKSKGILDRDNTFTKKMKEAGLLGDSYGDEEQEAEKKGEGETYDDENKKRKRRNRMKYVNIRKFEDYKEDYIYPWNLRNKIDFPIDYKISIYEKISERRENELFSIKSQKGDSSVELTKTELFDLLKQELSYFPDVSYAFIYRYQREFVENFPLKEFLKLKQTNFSLEDIKSRIRDKRIGEFIYRISKFCYFLFLKEFFNGSVSPLKSVYSQKRELIVIFENCLDLFRSRTRESHLEKVVVLPMILLSIRVINENIHRTCYPTFFQTEFSEDLKQRMDTLITFLIDPQYYSSHFASITQNIKSRKMEKRILKIMKTSKNQKNVLISSSVSPMVRMLLKNPQSTGARGLLQDDVEVAYTTIMKELLDDTRLRAKLVSIVIKRSSINLFAKKKSRKGRGMRRGRGRGRERGNVGGSRRSD